MEARSVENVPIGDEWQYEPKWDGFRVTFGVAAADRTGLTQKLEPLIEEPGFIGNAPGGPSRWNRGKENAWQPLKPKLVVEVSFDHVTSGRFRHGTKLLRWRPDKAPEQCTMDQLAQKQSDLLRLLK
jgi:ATP-dependent DNA ligase